MQLPGSLLALSPGRLRTNAEFPALLEALDAALEAGLPAVLLREPLLPAKDLLALAVQFVERCASHAARWCAVHDAPHIALEAGAAGVHLGFRSLTPAVVRECVGEGLCIGFSAHAGECPSAWRGADYLFFGPLYPTPKPEAASPPVGLEALGAFAREADLPVLALGGIDPERAAACAARAAGVAVLSGILLASDPGPATRRYLTAQTPRP